MAFRNSGSAIRRGGPPSRAGVGFRSQAFHPIIVQGRLDHTRALGKRSPPALTRSKPDPRVTSDLDQLGSEEDNLRGKVHPHQENDQ